MGSVGLTIHEGWNGSFVVGIGEEDQFFVDKFSEGHMLNSLAVQEGLRWRGEERRVTWLHVLGICPLLLQPGAYILYECMYIGDR